MSSRSRLALLVGVVLLGAGVYGIFALMREDPSDPGPAARAYLAAWEEGDWDAMAARVVDPPTGFADAQRQRLRRAHHRIDAEPHRIEP